MTPTQKAMVAARAREFYDKAAKERQKAHGNTAPGKRKTVVENLPPVSDDTGKARDAVGKAVGVSGKSVDYATKVLEKGEPELVKAVNTPRMSPDCHQRNRVHAHGANGLPTVPKWGQSLRRNPTRLG